MNPIIKELQSSYNTLTAESIASLAAISVRAVHKRKDVKRYIMSYRSNGGRPQAIFHPNVLKLFGIELEEKDFEAEPKRKPRNDVNLSRILDEEREEKLISQILDSYLSQANRKFIYNCTKHVCLKHWNLDFDYYSKIFNSWIKFADYIYKNRVSRTDRNYIGYAHRHPSWEVQWAAKWKKQDRALKRLPVNRYDWLSLAEDAGIAGQGFGAGTIWVIDDHRSDSFLYDDSRIGYKGSMLNGLFMIDGLTGMFLDYMPGEPTTANLVILLLRNILKLGLPYAIVLENSKVMKNLKVDNIINSLYPDKILDDYSTDKGDWFHTFFPGAKAPLVRNIPNIPRFPFKARLERLFQEVKAHDGWNFPVTYQGGGIDQVQLRISTLPAQPSQSYNITNYIESLKSYLSSNYLDKIRTSMFQSFYKSTNLIPTINNVADYYGINSAGTHLAPSDDKLAFSLYWFSKIDIDSPIISRESKAKAGYITCSVNGRQFQFVDSELAKFEGQKITMVFIPNTLNDNGYLGDYAALFSKKQDNNVELISICRDTFNRKLSDVRANRQHLQDTRKEMRVEIPLSKVKNEPTNYEVKQTIDKNQIESEQKPKIEIQDKELLNLLTL